MPYIITHLQNETKLTRKTIVRILLKADNLDLFKSNPISYMTQASRIINHHKNNIIIEGIQCYKNGEEFNRIIFTSSDQMTTYLEEKSTDYKVSHDPDKTPYNYIKTDSIVENKFAEQLDRSTDVKFYVKLPREFLIDTPIGGYNPDWALVLEEEGEDRIYFVTETKGSKERSAWRPTEQKKIHSGDKHFEALGTGVRYMVATGLEDLR